MIIGIDMLPEVQKLAVAERLWREGDCIIVAVSGGPDSMALLHLMSRLKASGALSVVAAHVNHGFRPEESALEAEVVQRYAGELGLPFELAELDLPAYIEETKMNAQSAARAKRYAYLHEVAERWGAQAIALAHHADDQAETVLMHLIRGSGLSGLSGMSLRRQEKNVELIRPLMRKNKTDLLQYCRHYGIPYCEDSSNEKRHYFRNVVRLDVIPQLSSFNPQLSESLGRLAEVAGAEDEWLDSQTKALFEELAYTEPEECSVSCSRLAGLHVALQRRLIKLILDYLSRDADVVSFEHIESMRLAAAPESSSTWRMDIGNGLRCLREYDHMRFVRLPKQEEANTDYALAVVPLTQEYIEVEAGGWKLAFERRTADDQAAGKLAGRHEACFDMEQLAFPLTVRNRRRGDRIQVLGLNGSKKVQDMFVDEKLPPSQRERYPLLFDADGRLLWIPGIRRSGHALIIPSTKELLFIRLTKE
ncbi:tRNA(Ile)-lysidine synthase [Paenibacillus algorifonticola]|uniref:tRNA(Ile)-lysidine synthase n=1 Tax=Paenibacillus algorifonticola TaxID=684063 RepID=A0A1I2ILG5_9BACL|nr:tRNA lysidine(34) synthetase TilS [Paenibacillus algorifonticola]SFF43155.1 tRNA(Ile)-lysidine synthase [Paenibacillus algorifonticola]